MLTNIIYSKNESRPSRSILDPILYTEFKTLPFDPYENCKTYNFTECTQNLENDYIVIKDYKYFSDVVKTINKSPDLNFLIEIKDIYYYPKVQFIELLTIMFNIVEYKFSQFTNVCYIYCKTPIKHIEMKPGLVKDFSIKVRDDIINTIYNYNNDYFKKLIKLNDILSIIYDNYLDLSIIYNEIKIINDYYISYITKTKCYKICNCDNLFNSMLLNCYICKECFSLNIIEV